MWKWIVSILFLLLLFIGIRTKKRGYFWKDVQGNKLSFREFLKRWKTGVEGVTGKQQKFTQLLGTCIALIGILAGITVNIIIRAKNFWWWVTLILVGSLIITITQLIGTYQSYLRFKQIEEQMKKLK